MICSLSFTTLRKIGGEKKKTTALYTRVYGATQAHAHERVCLATRAKYVGV